MTTRAIGIVRLDSDGTITNANDVACRSLGHASSELVGRSLQDVIVSAAGTSLLSQMTDCSGELAFRRHDGSVVTATCSVIGLPGDGYILTLAEPDTEAVAETVDLVSRQESLYRALVSNLPNAAAFVVDRELRYRLAVGEALTGAGFTREAFEGKPLKDVLPPAEAEHHSTRYRQVLSGMTLVHEHEAWGHHYVTHAIPLRMSDGTVYAALAVSHDITERKMLERQLRDEIRNNENFINVLGHDLRNPLSAIVGSAELLREGHTKDITISRWCDRITASATRMHRLIVQLLDTARIRQGLGLAISPRPTNLETIAKRIVEELEITWKDATFVTEVDGDPCGVWDNDRIGQLLSNLLGNAVQHATTQQITLRINGTDPSVITCAIHNPGEIPDVAVDTLFEPFQRASRTEVSSKGLGLGLFISREIARSHDGDLTVSTDEHGTTFLLTLPRVAGPPPS